MAYGPVTVFLVLVNLLAVVAMVCVLAVCVGICLAVGLIRAWTWCRQRTF